MRAVIRDFDSRYIEDGAKFLQNAQNNQFEKLGFSYRASLEICKQRITDELEKEVSSAHIVMADDRFAGFAIATVKRDSVWGDSGWVNLGAWCIDPDHISGFPYMYQQIARNWVQKKILRHCFMVFASDRNGIDMLNNMGFGKEQTHAVLDLAPISDFHHPEGAFCYRKADRSDQPGMNGFSRLIAEFQTQSPCFASAPTFYLEDLDKGFSDITADPEIDLYVAADGSVLAGYQGYYEAGGADLITPPKSVELAVSGIKEEYRNRGCGLHLTGLGLSEQKKRGYDFAVTDWRCANLLSGPFWTKTGFAPVAYRMIRRIDPLITGFLVVE